jgi:hypothetical protein
MFTQVNFRCINKIGDWLNERGANDHICLRQSTANRRSGKRVEAQDLVVNQQSRSSIAVELSTVVQQGGFVQ